jgi:hypothetical protein
MNSSFTFDSSLLVFIFLVFVGSMILIALTFWVWVVLRIRRINLPPDADFLSALRATPLIVVIALDALDLGMNIFSAPIAWALLSYLGLAPLRGVATVKALIPISGFIPLMTLSWLYARFVEHRAITSGSTLPRAHKPLPHSLPKDQERG